MRVERIGDATLYLGDCIESMRRMDDGAVNTCVTSPPYFGLRDYGVEGQIGAESTPEEFVQALVRVFREVRRVLRGDGTVWLNLGDSYAAGKTGRDDAGKDIGGRGGNLLGSGNPGGGRARPLPPGLKPKDIIGIPWRVAFALQADGWYLRQDIIWHKPNAMPESVRDRCTKAHEYVFLLSKGPRYYFDSEAVKEPVHPNKGKRNRRSVWTVATRPYRGAHFATFPPDLIEPCILAGCPGGGVVLDPFGGSGTTAGVALKHNRSAVICEIHPEYAQMVPGRIERITRGGQMELVS